MSLAEWNRVLRDGKFVNPDNLQQRSTLKASDRPWNTLTSFRPSTMMLACDANFGAHPLSPR
jgi:hypothetical protein